MPSTHIAALRALLEREKGVLVPGAPNALAARIIADLGFKAVYLTGAGLTNMHLGLPDLGFMDLSQVVEHTIAVRGVLPEESLGRLLFLDNNLYEVGRRTGLFAMNPGQSPCDCFLLIVVYRTLG